MEKILYSSRIKKLFEKYASLTDKNGEKVMTMDDFVRSCQDTSVIDVIKYSQLRSLYRIIRGWVGRMNLSVLCLLLLSSSYLCCSERPTDGQVSDRPID